MLSEATFGLGFIIALCATFLILVSLALLVRKFINAPRPMMELLDERIVENTYECARWISYPVWRTDVYGNVVWSNIAFDDVRDDMLRAVDDLVKKKLETGRISISKSGEVVRWFDISMRSVSDECVWFATPADAIIEAEHSRRELVQTLSSTFAQLTTGLAIFNKDRTLVLFNPALLQLTGLSFETCSRSPKLDSFLDDLRNRGLLPEPRDYGEWRDEIARLESQARESAYRENWYLPDGRTYRATGKPHPNGAIAFLIEDVSEDVRTFHNMRRDLEKCRDALQGISVPVAILASDGDLWQVNTAFQKLWGVPDVTKGRNISLFDLIELCQLRSQSKDVWDQLRNFVGSYSKKSEWQGTIEMDTGETVNIRFVAFGTFNTLIECSFVRE